MYTWDVAIILLMVSAYFASERSLLLPARCYDLEGTCYDLG
eukprot:CAMPEP_0196653906 /NCGR_PEP_ID=MMETSP1086-20130531/3571_1 /TAXON_ID=77921 /ORGANISM="Cyanoptyche  gloeocystis , Strain SAG4.97" /LENGTH=40 /DNA_ID= /DNA_START= /DNA_END= /DNA_ORIENTATION=